MTFPSTLPGPTIVARRAATGLALALLALGGAGTVTIATTAVAGHSQVSTPAATSTTGKPAATDNGTATAFGQQVKAEVATCKANLPAGQHGIGSCVSAWVTAHNPSNTNSGAGTDSGSNTAGRPAASHRGH